MFACYGIQTMSGTFQSKQSVKDRAGIKHRQGRDPLETCVAKGTKNKLAERKERGNRHWSMMAPGGIDGVQVEGSTEDLSDGEFENKARKERDE